MLTADAGEAARRAAGEARASLGGVSPSFGVLFASAHFLGSAEALVARWLRRPARCRSSAAWRRRWPAAAREVESGPAVSLWLAAELGPVETFAMEFVRTASGGAFGGYRFGPDPAGVHLMLCDPFTFPAGDLLAHLNSTASPGRWSWAG